MKQEFPAVRIMRSGNGHYAPLWRGVCAAAGVKDGDQLTVWVENGVITLKPMEGLQELVDRIKTGGTQSDDA